MKRQKLSYADLISKAREKRDFEYKKLSNFTLAQIHRAVSSSLSQIKTGTPVCDPTSCFNHGTLVFTLIKLCNNNNYLQLQEILENLQPEHDQEVEIFIFFVYSKLIKHLSKKSIEDKIVSLEQRLLTGNPLPVAYFLRFLAENCPNSILFCAHQYLQVAKMSIFHKSNAVQMVAYKALKIFLEYLYHIKTPQIQSIVSDLMVTARSQGSLMIYSCILETVPSLVQSYIGPLATYLTPSYQKYPSELRGIALHVIVLVWVNYPKSIDNIKFELVRSTIWRETISNPTRFSTRALLLLLQNDSSIVSPTEFVPALIAMFKKNLKPVLKNGIDILKRVAEINKDVINRNATAIAFALDSIAINERFISVAANLFVKFVGLWIAFKPLLQSKIYRDPQKLENPLMLMLIAKCPPLNEPEITQRLYALCESNNYIVRAFVPDALLAQYSFKKQTIDMTPIRKMITLALSDPVAFVREKVLLSLSNDYIQFIASEDIVHSIKSLVKDESCPVRNAAIKIIGKIAKFNPFDAYPILRKVLLDTLFLLDSPKSLVIKHEVASSFVDLIEASFDAISAYSTTLCDITLRQISFQPTCELTYFDTKVLVALNTNLIKGIGLIAERNIDLLEQHIVQFHNFFLWMLQQHGPKKLKLAVVTTMYSILTHCGDVPGLEVLNAFPTLIDIASMWDSRKLNVAVLKLIGFIGAANTKGINTISESQEILGSRNKDEYLMNIACKTLLGVLQEDSLIVHHMETMKALVDIFCMPILGGFEYFSDFMNIFLEKIAAGNPVEYMRMLQKICLEAPAGWVNNFAEDLLELIQKLWVNASNELLLYIIDLIPILAAVLVDDFMHYITQCIQFLLNCLYTHAAGTSNAKNNETVQIDIEISIRSLMAIMSFREISNDFLFIIIPDIIATAKSDATMTQVKVQTLDTLRVFIQKSDCSDYASSIILCALKNITSNNAEIINASLQVFYSIMFVLGKEHFTFFEDQVRSSIIKRGISLNNFNEILQRSDDAKITDFPFINISDPSSSITKPKKPIEIFDFDETKIVEALGYNDVVTAWNRKEWWHNLVETTLRCSPSHFIRRCAFLCKSLFHLAETLFNPAFLSCWKKMSVERQTEVSGYITSSCLSDPLPNQIRSSLVNLFEYMEQCEEKFEIEDSVIIKACEDSSQYAKALYFAQRSFYNEGNDITNVENLIRLSTSLGLTKTVKGLSLLVKDMSTQATWCEQLGQWEIAKDLYRKNTDPRLKEASFAGILRCLKHQKRWDEIIAQECHLDDVSNVMKQELFPVFASAYFHRQMWNKLGQILDLFPKETVSVLIIDALYESNINNKEKAKESVAKAFRILADKSRTYFKHDRSSLYPIFVKAQQLNEVSEIIDGKQGLDSLWEKRIKLCKEEFNVYHSILSVRLTHLSVQKMQKPIIKMLKIALRRGDLDVFDSTFQFLYPDRIKWSHDVEFLYIKGMWAHGKRERALSQLKVKLESLKTAKSAEKPSQHVLSRMFFQCGNWMLQVNPNMFFERKMDQKQLPGQQIKSLVFNPAFQYLSFSMKLDGSYYKSFHRWAWANSIAYQNLTSHHDELVNKGEDPEVLKKFTDDLGFNAILAFSKCVNFMPFNSFSDLIQMFSLFPQINIPPEKFVVLMDVVNNFDASEFLMVIPQIFAQLGRANKDENSQCQSFITSIILKLLPEHFHVLLFPLLLLNRKDKEECNDSLENPEEDREFIEEEIIEDHEEDCYFNDYAMPQESVNVHCNSKAGDMINKFYQENPIAVNEAMTISDGLLLCSSTRIETWFEMTAFALRSLNKKNIEKTNRILNAALCIPQQPCNEIEVENQILGMLRNVYYTLNSGSFSVPDLVKELNGIYNNIKKYLDNVKQVDMHVSAPELAELRESVMAVPGTYVPNRKVTKIQYFEPTLDIYNSKQRPRMLMIMDEYGIQHRSLLKGHEDLRLDQRIMQFFDLINQHTVHDFPDESKDLKIFRYSITPISKKSGLIQYVDGADTMYTLISEFRIKRGVDPFVEQVMMKDLITCNVDNLTSIQRYEVLTTIADQTPDTDLRSIIWLKSPSSNEWIRRYIRFAQSSALMSIIGYIIGLGDRHPSNLMIHQSTGSVIHIDFGDCFEVSCKRIRFPELIPFRLTRMMVSAFGPTGIEGDFRLTAEETLSLVRSHRESIRAVLDIFLQEPLEAEDGISGDEAMESAPENEEYVDDSIEQQFSLQSNDDDTPIPIKESVNRINNKIIGRDFDKSVESSVQAQADILINTAIDMYNMSHLYHGWTPLW